MKRSITRLTFLPCAVAAAALVVSCSDQGKPPVAPNGVARPSLAVQDLYDGGPIHGAIFTTTPNGGTVNANVQYTDKRQVYLDGGPRGNAPITAAGLPNGLYVFQITEPPGKVLLSDDPSKCRVVRVEGGVIKELVKPADLPAPYGPLSNTFGTGQGTACHVQDAPDGVAGASGRHDTNTDIDHGTDGAIVVQMMPFLDTPNPGGVYKAWITPLQVYVAKGGNLSQQTNAAKVQGKVVGYARDPGFAPPLSKVKTDNFKVKQNPPSIVIDKLVDANLDGSPTGDASYAIPPGWPVSVTETVDGGTVTNDYYTPTGNIGLPVNSTVRVCERVLADWTFSYVIVNGQNVVPLASPTTDGQGNPIVCVNVTVGSSGSVAVAFGNIPPQPSLDGRMTGGTGKVEITSNVYLTAGFTIHCDILLSNNLEINWPGHKWHLSKPITFARCTDDPNVDPGQPDAPFDTFYGRGIGELDGVPNSLVTFTFVDAGEPGKIADRASIAVYNGPTTGYTRVLNVYNQAIKGNLQAHEDQPHK